METRHILVVGGEGGWAVALRHSHVDSDSLVRSEVYVDT